MEKLLYSSSEIRTELIEMLNHKSEEKIVIVAFIGKGAEKYIPFSTEKLSIYCCPRKELLTSM